MEIRDWENLKPNFNRAVNTDHLREFDVITEDFCGYKMKRKGIDGEKNYMKAIHFSKKKTDKKKLVRSTEKHSEN